MSFSIKADGICCKCHLTDSEVQFSAEFQSVKIKIEDIIGCEVVSTSWFFNRPALNLWHILQAENNFLRKAKIQITGEENVWRNLKNKIQEKLTKLTKRPKSLLVLINPIGGKKRAVKEYQNTVSPIFGLADIKCDVIESKRPKHMVEIVTEYDTSGIDGIVVLGGDGSFTEVANVLIRKMQEEAAVDCNDPRAEVQPIKIPINMIPTGTGNCFAGRTAGVRDIVTAALHVVRGYISYLNVFGVYADDKLVDYSGACSSHGIATEISYLSDVKYRWLGAIRYYVVPLSFLFYPVFKTYNAEITCYTHGTHENEPPREDINSLYVNGRIIRHAVLKDRSKDSVTFEGRFTGIFSWCRNLINVENNTTDWKHTYRLPQNVFSTLFYNSNLTVIKMANQIKDMMSQSEGKEEDDFYDTVNIRGLKVRVTDKDKSDGSEDDLIRHLLMVDGEIYTIKDVDFQFWLHENIVPVFSNCTG